MPKDGIWNSLIIGVCVVIAGLGIGLGFYKGRASDRFVTVKGLAEREVTADLAIWPITFNVAENNLSDLNKGIDLARETIRGFLIEEGFKLEEISYSAPKISDTEAERGSDKEFKGKFRYVAQATMTARTRDVNLTKKTMEKSGKLVGKGIVLGAQNWQIPTEFLFTGLNKIKPEMIEEATKNARETAEKFAKDSASKLGKIRNASQGYFEINDRDKNSPELKIIRVVTTVQYYLAD